MMFRDPLGDTRRQVEAAITEQATTVIALDFLFWDVYGSSDAAWHRQVLQTGLDELDKARTTGAWIIVGDIPLEPDDSRLGRVLLVPLVEWTAPLRAGTEVMPTGEKVPAAELVAIDGLHANPLGDWYVLDKLDHYIEQKLPGTPEDALVFERPAGLSIDRWFEPQPSLSIDRWFEPQPSPSIDRWLSPNHRPCIERVTSPHRSRRCCGPRA